MGKARRPSVAQRRGSVLNVAAPKLAKRLELQKVFNSLLVGNETTVDKRSLMMRIMQAPELHGVFTTKQSEELSYCSADPSIGWDEFLEFVQKTEGSSNDNNDASGRSNEIRIDDPLSYQELVECQSKALGIERLPNNELCITIMDSSDVRALMGGKRILTVNSLTSDLINVVSEYAHRNDINEDEFPLILDYTERAISKACQQELRLLVSMTDECIQQMEAMASHLLVSEAKMLQSINENERSKFMFEQSSSKDRRGSVTADVARAYSASVGGDVSSIAQTPGELAAKVCQLQKRYEQRELELKHYQKISFRRRASQALLAGAPLQDIEATLAERDEWRKEVDSRIALIKVTNAERLALVRDNITLRTTVECGRQAGMFDKLRKKILTERESRLFKISALENEIAEMEAELRIVALEIEELDECDSEESDNESV